MTETQTYTWEQASEITGLSMDDLDALSSGLDHDGRDVTEGGEVTERGLAALRAQAAATTHTAEYTSEGYIYVDGVEYATYDADGGEWDQPVRDLLTRHGYTPVGEWVTDADYVSTISVIGPMVSPVAP